MTNQAYYTADELLQVNFPTLQWYVQNILTTGLTLLWGSPKSGKSIAALQLLTAVSAGVPALGGLQTIKADAALISLEDGPRRIQTRLRSAPGAGQGNLHLYFKWSRGKQGADDLERLLDENPAIKVIGIDTWALLTKVADSNDYSLTTDSMEKLKAIADDRDVCILMIHHAKKRGNAPSAKDEDILETALGSTGITAGPDHLLYLQRTPQGQSDGVLHFRSKDAEGSELALQFDPSITGWRYKGDAQELAATTERQEVLEVIAEARKAVGPSYVAKETGRERSAVGKLMAKLCEEGKLWKVGYGKFAIEPDTPHPTGPTSPTSEGNGTTGSTGNGGGDPPHTPYRELDQADQSRFDLIEQTEIGIF